MADPSPSRMLLGLRDELGKSAILAPFALYEGVGGGLVFGLSTDSGAE